MPNPFAVSALTSTVKLDSNRQGEASFSVTNNSGHQVRAGARLELAPVAGGQVSPPVTPGGPAGGGPATATVPAPATAETIKWLSFVEEGQPPAPSANPQYTERDFNIGGTQQFRVRIVVPQNAPGGLQNFYVHFTDVQLPDEEFTDSPIVSFEVPAPAPKKGFPWWIPVAAAVALVLVIVAVILLVLPPPTPTPTPVATTAPTTPPATTAAAGSNLVGTWLNVENINGLSRLDITAQGSFVKVHALATGAPPLDWGTNGADFTTSPFNITFDLGSGGKHSLKLTEFENADGKRMLVEDSLNGAAAKSFVFRNQTCTRPICFVKPNLPDLGKFIGRDLVGVTPTK
ncbi:MAG: hypothetical protein J0I20_13460 [Chloroflexi bacterium]|nr:hypothetical protein [Chloroflexota bacterium]OJV92846.1 MAG: hypothetical protein BGO39_30290 [Chloroflexi bacterium 54-19]